MLRKDNCKPSRESFEFLDLVRLILEVLRYLFFVVVLKGACHLSFFSWPSTYMWADRWPTFPVRPSPRLHRSNTASTWGTLIRVWTTCCPACRTTLVATRFRVVVICPIIQVPHCISVFFYFVWFVFINHIFQFDYELCTYCNILDIYLS